jgi:CHAD domain-containing protein
MLHSNSSKINITLKPQLPAGKALRKIYSYLLQKVKENKNGIINNIDTEFLHDFRVSVRRTRSALSQIKNILDKDIVQKAKKDFTYLGQSTNLLRDIDVYLLKEDQYKKMLPGNRRDYLNPFFEDLKRQRKIENALVVKILKSMRYKRIINEWEFYLNAKINTKNLTATEKKPIIIVARKVICERNQKMLEFGKNIIITSSDELLHQLRITGKKLRYLLEFFNSLFPQTEMQILIKKLKNLQDNLGDYHDLAVHQEMLKKFAEQLTTQGSGEKETILTLGILTMKLNEKQELVKKDFFETFHIYSSPEIQKIFHALFYDSILQER